MRGLRSMIARLVCALVLVLSPTGVGGQALRSAAAARTAQPARAGTQLPAAASQAAQTAASGAPASAGVSPSYAAFITVAGAHPVAPATAADAVPLYGQTWESAQPLGPYRTTVTVHGLPDMQWLQNQQIPILAATSDSATVLVYRHQLEVLAQRQMFPHDTDLVSDLQSAAGTASGPQASAADNLSTLTSAQILAAATSAGLPGDLPPIEKSWWCLDPNNPDSNGDGVSDAQTLQDLLDWLQHKRSDRGPGKPFAGWPVNIPGCIDSDGDSVPDAAEAFMLGLNPQRTSTAHDQYSDGEKLFGDAYSPTGTINLPSWVVAPYDNPFVAAFPVIDVSIVPNSLTMARITTITTISGTMTMAQKSYSTSVTNETSDSIANTTTWNSWQEVSQATSKVSAPSQSPSAISRSSEPISSSVDWGQLAYYTVLAAGHGAAGVAAAAATVLQDGCETDLPDHAQEAACLAAWGVGRLVAGDVASSQFAQAGTDLQDAFGSLNPDAVQTTLQPGKYCSVNDPPPPPPSGPVCSLNSTLSSSPASTGAVAPQPDPNSMTLAQSVTGTQYASGQQNDLLAQSVRDVAYAITAPRETVTNTSGQSWGGALTTTHEVSQAQTVTNGDAFTTGQDWSTATAVDSSHAAQLKFTYSISNDGTDCSSSVGGLIFNIYLGSDASPIDSYPAWQQFPNDQLPLLCPGDLPYTYTTNPIVLTLDEMRRIDTGAAIRVVLESYTDDIQATYKNAVGAGLNVTIDTAEDTGTTATHSYLLPIVTEPTAPTPSIQDVLTRFFPAEYDSQGNINCLSVPQYSGSAAPTWVQHCLTDNSWWHVYLTQTITGSTQLKDIPAIANPNGNGILIRFDQDSDRDGYPDRVEQQYDTNLSDPTSHPAPDLIAAVMSSPSGASVGVGTQVTAELALENAGSFEADSIQAVMYAPDNTTTIDDDIVGGNGVVAAGAHVAVGSLVDPPDVSNWTSGTDAAVPYSGGNFSGTGDITYTFTVGTAGAVGSGSTSMSWASTAGGSGSFNLGSGYLGDQTIPVDQGVDVWFDTGSTTAGASFSVTAHAPEDTFRYTVNHVPYTPPVVVVTYSDPQGSHRFETPVQVASLDTSLASHDSQMLRDVGIHIWPTGPVTTTASNTTNIILDSPAASPIQGGHVYLDFVANGTVVDHVDQPVTVTPGPLVVPVVWATSAFTQTYDPTADNILIASWTDGQGNIIDSTARPLNTFAADPTPALNVASTTWNFGTVTQGAILTYPLTIANTGLVPLDLGTASADATIAISPSTNLTSVPPTGSANLTLTLDTSTLSGSVSKTLTIPSSDPAHPTTTLTITGNVTAPTGAAQAFAVPNHPLDQLVRVYGTVPQFTTVSFAPTIQPDQSTIEPCMVYDASGSTLKGTGQDCTDFGNGVALDKFLGNGQDGDLVVSGSTDLNPVRASASGMAGAATLQISNVTGGAFQAGDLILVHQTRGIDAGQWEYATVQSATPAQLVLVSPLAATYVTDAGADRAQAIWVPQYRNLTISSGVTVSPAPWNGYTGGITVVLASGVFTLDGSINATGEGFRGPSNITSSGSALQGEGTGGDSSYSTAANGNGGGGGQGARYGGGSGASGGNATAGTAGTTDPDGGAGGSPGGPAGTADLTAAVFGGAGGAGGNANYVTNRGGGGGSGGGFVVVQGGTIDVGGSIAANGNNGGNVAGSDGSGGGAGAGGSVLIRGRDVSLGSGLVAALGSTIGGNKDGGGVTGAGNASDGRVRVEYCDSYSGTTSPAASVAQLSCYIASKSDASTVQFQVPDSVTGGQSYLLQFARHLTFTGGQGTQSNVLQVPAQVVTAATMNVLVTNLGSGGVSNLGVSVGGVQVYSSTQSFAQATTVSLPDFSGALNAYLAGNPGSGGTVDVPVQVSLNGQADVLLTDLALTPGTGADLAVSSGDLAFGCPGAAGCPASEGATVPMTLTIHNPGSQDASSVVVGYFLGNPQQGGTLLGSSFTPLVAAGSSAQASFAWNTTGITGTQSIYAMVDPLDSLGESQRGNNTTSNSLPVLTPADLVVSGISFNHTDRVVGEPVTASVVIANSGQTPAPPTTTHLLLVGQQGDSLTADVSTGSVPANATVSISDTFLPAVVGTHVLTATADATGAVDESSETNNIKTSSVMVGLGHTYIDAGSAGDLAYTATAGYGYLGSNTSTRDFGGGTAASTVRFSGTGPVQYEFDGLQPGRFYHLDATFFQKTGSFTQTVAFNGTDSGKVISLSNGVVSGVSLLVPPTTYSSGSLVVSFQRPTLGPAFVSELALTPVQYTYIDAGSAGDSAYSVAQGYGYLDAADSYEGSLGGSDAVSTYRTSFTDTVAYQFDGLIPTLAYQIDLTMYGGSGAATAQSVSVDGEPVAACGSLPVNVLQRVQCTVDPSLYTTSGSVQVQVRCTAAGCAGPVVNEIALEQLTFLPSWPSAPAGPVTVAGVQVTDLSPMGFAVVFTTNQAVAANLAVGTSTGSLSTVAYDDRDGRGPATTASTVHRFTLSGLTPGTTYYFEPVIGGTPQPGPGGAAYSRAVPNLSSPPSLPSQAMGSVLLQDGTWPLSGTVLLTGYWTNPDGSQSAPLSVLNATQVISGNYNYCFGTSIPLAQDGSAYFSLGKNSVFHVSGAGDQSGQLGHGGPSSATLSSPITNLPSFRIGLTVSVTYNVQRGWNLLALPLAPTAPIPASTLLAGLLAQTGGSYAEIDGFTNGAWTPSYFQEVRPTPLTGGSDYALALGQGYALYSDQSGSITFTGAVAAAQTVSLARGWNLVGFTDAYGSANPAMASGILSGLLGQTGGNYAELDGFTAGQWKPSFFEEVSPPVVSPSDYSVTAGQGYALYTDKGSAQQL